jgi:hypothetical protein
MATGPNGLNRPTTRGVVLDLIRAARTISRVKLAAGSGLTAPTITQVVRELIEDGLVVEAGRGESTGGKPRTLLQLNPQSRYGVGVLLERYTSVVVIVDLAGQPVARASFEGTGLAPPDETLRRVAEHVDSLLAHAGVARSKVLGLGLVGHGPQDRGTGTMLAPQPNPEWDGYPVARRLTELVSLPVLLDRATFSRAAHRVRVALSASGWDAAAVGGAALVLRSELTPRHLRRPDGGSLTYAYSAGTPA